MIIQGLLDFVRDIVVNFLVGLASLWPASAVDSVLNTISIPADRVGAVLAITFTPLGWGVMIALLATYAALFVGTGIIKAVAGRIGN